MLHAHTSDLPVWVYLHTTTLPSLLCSENLPQLPPRAYSFPQIVCPTPILLLWDFTLVIDPNQFSSLFVNILIFLI